MRRALELLFAAGLYFLGNWVVGNVSLNGTLTLPFGLILVLIYAYIVLGNMIEDIGHGVHFILKRQR